MKRSLLKYSAWISLVCLFCISCSSSRILVSGDSAGKLRESFVSGSFEKFTCKAKVTFRENELSGLMLFKNTGDGNYKIAFYNELGITYLEGLFENSSKHKKFIVKSIAPVLNHKSFINSFEKSLQIIFSKQNQPISQSTNHPINQSSNQPINQSSELIILLKKGFSLGLKPQ